MPSRNLTLADLPAPPTDLTLDQLPAPPTALDRWKARAESLGAGLEDIISGPAVGLSRAVPTPVADRLNALNNWLAQRTGLLPMLPPGGQAQLQAEREAALARTRQAAGLTGEDWSRLGGQVLPWLAIPELRLAGMGARMLYGGATGAVQGLEQPTTGPNAGADQAKNALLGAGVGAVLPPLASSAGRALRGVQDPAVRLLAKAGVPLTPGQLFGGVARGAEERVAGFPLVGDIVKSAERRGLVQFNRATADQVLAPLGKTVPTDVKPGYDLLNHVHGVLDDAYDGLKDKIHGELDPQFVKDLAFLRRVGQQLPPDQRNQLDNFLKTDILDRFNPKTGQTTGAMVKDIETKLGAESRPYMRSPNPDQKKLGAILQQAQMALRRMLERANPAQRGQLQKLNLAYARYLRMQEATGQVGGVEGIFTPAQLRSAIRSLDASARKGEFRRGSAMLQPWAEAGQKVLGNKVPDSGTAGRALLGAAALGAPGLLHPILGAGVAGAVLYNRLAERAMQELATRTPGPATNALALLFERAPTTALTAGLVPALAGGNQ